ncbi:MAG: signal peptidase II [Bacilli bacterium]|nr:signal peptidase II [Bacilli bacterium]
MKKILIFSLIFIIIDVVVKVVVSNCIGLYDTIKVIPGFFNLTYLRNTGAAFSIMENNRMLFIIIGLVAIFLIYKFLIKDKYLNKLSIISYSMLLGGIMGNMIDRILYGYVIDYLSFNLFGFNAPIFNLADTFIVVSVILIFINEGVISRGRVSSR